MNPLERRFSHTVECIYCHGTKRVDGAVCPLCAGAGTIRPRLPSGDWLPKKPNNINCPACGGTGKPEEAFLQDAEGRCKYCGGAGEVDRDHEISRLMRNSPLRGRELRVTDSPRIPPDGPTRLDMPARTHVHIDTSQILAIVRALTAFASMGLTARQCAIHPTTGTRPLDPSPTLPHKAIQRPWWHVLIASLGTMGALASIAVGASILNAPAPVTAAQQQDNIPTSPTSTAAIVASAASPSATNVVPTATHATQRAAPTITSSPTAPQVAVTATATLFPTVTTAPPTPTILVPTPTIPPPTLEVVPSTFTVTCPRTSVVLALDNPGTGYVTWTASVSNRTYLVNGGVSATGTLNAGDPPFYLTVTNISTSGTVTLVDATQSIVIPITCH